jgi:hypothetical protein
MNRFLTDARPATIMKRAKTGKRVGNSSDILRLGDDVVLSSEVEDLVVMT